MNKKEFITKVTDVLRENDIRKPVSIKKNSFRITDADGKTADFTVKQQDKAVIYTSDDVANIVGACLTVIEDSMKSGEEIAFRGFGALGLKYRAPRRVKNPGEGTWYTIDGHYIPKFLPGKVLKMAAKVFELSLKDRASAPKLPDPVYDEYD